MANETKELFDLTVDELSLVNFPANEEELLVVKQLYQEDITMPNTEQATVENAAEEAVVQPEVVETPVTVEKDAVEVAAEASVEEAAEEVVESTEEDQLVTKVAEATAQAVTKSMGEFADMLRTMLAPEAEATAEVAEPEVVAEEVEATAEVEADVSKSLLTKLDALVTALTPTKVEKSAEVVEDKEESAVLKALSQLEEKFEKQLTGMDSRLAEIEGVQQPSNALEAVTDTTVEKAAEKSIWDGLL